MQAPTENTTLVYVALVMGAFTMGNRREEVGHKRQRLAALVPQNHRQFTDKLALYWPSWNIRWHSARVSNVP
jgi:hypothetical protein